MARLIPHADPSHITLEPERQVAERLCAQLPKNAFVFHSYPWLRPERDLDRRNAPTILREGEADFVVVHPRYGIAIVEVKGGYMRYNPVNLQWDRAGGTHDVTDPFAQASKNMRAIEGQIKQRSFGSYPQLPFSRVRCVVFPNCDYSGTMPPGAHETILVGASDLARLGEKIEDLFKLQPFVPSIGLSPTSLDGIVRALTSTFQLIPALWSELEEQEKRLFRFTEAQTNILLVLQAHTRATIQGVAGSGKTVLAVTKARQFADEGKRVLFVCFNEMLAEWVRSQLPAQYHAAITVRNYHKLCSEWVKAAGLKWPTAIDETSFFKEDAPKLLEEAIDRLPDKCFDAVVVDEGQDFIPEWWDTLELINRQPTEGPLYIFFDPDQQIFQSTAPAMPDLGRPFLLPVNCRNTERIASQCGAILGKKIPVNCGTPEGRLPKSVVAPTPAQQIQEVERQIKEWMTPGTGLKANQIAIVTCGNVQKSSLGGLKSIAGIPLTTDLGEWQRGRAVLLTSLYRFKGLEADALILADVVAPNLESSTAPFRPQHFYVACSRAKHLLTILLL
ncbi:MAG: hypothetical protein JWL59_4349 [Chthoniobacteraceae bacterium]|nr:hypothetical protein [Chthoniobacteraceae bacterium]